MAQDITINDTARQRALQEGARLLSLPPALGRLIRPTPARITNGFHWPEEWRCPTTIPAAVKADLPAAIASYQAALVPAKRTFVVKQLMQLALLFPTKRSDIEWKAVFETFADDLREIPADIITEAIKLHRQHSPFFPAIAELYVPASDILLVRQTDFNRAQALLAVESDEEREERQRQEIAEKEAAIEKLRAAQPWRRIIATYDCQLRFSSQLSWRTWLQCAVADYGHDTVAQWHEELLQHYVEDPLHYLKQRAAGLPAPLHIGQERG